MGAPNYLGMAGCHAPSADNSQPWQIRWNGEVLEVVYDSPRASGTTFDRDDPATLLAMGAVIENINQAALAIGLSLNAESASGDCFFRVKLSSSTVSEFDPGTDHPLFARHTNRLPYLVDPLPDDLIEWVSGQSEGHAHARIVTERQDIKRLADLVGAASALRFQNQEMHELLGRSLRFTPQEVSRGDGLDVSSFNLPPGGRLMLRILKGWRQMARFNRIGGYKLFARMETETFANASASIAIMAPTDREGGLAAGRLLERVWIELNRLGLAVHPSYVIPDFAFRLKDHRLPTSMLSKTHELVDATGKLLGLKNEALYMLLRVGYPTKLAVRSKRLPLEKLLVLDGQD